MNDQISVAVSPTGRSALLSEFSARHSLAEPGQAEVLIASDDHGLQLHWRVSSSQTLHYTIDVNKFVTRQSTYPAAKQAGLNQAIGKRTRTIIDATAGWGGDAMLLCAQGYQLTLIERNAVMALLLKDAMQRLAGSDWALRNQVAPIPVIEQDSIKLLAAGELVADCVYLDPMFPPRRKKSAAPNKQMQLSQRMVGADPDSDALLRAAMAGGYRRIVVKRPAHADPIVAPPSMQFASKLVHYDVYLNN